MFKAGNRPMAYLPEQAEDFIRDEIIPDFQESYKNTRKIEPGLELIVINMAPGPHWGERTNIFLIYEQHPAFNYPMIHDAMYTIVAKHIGSVNITQMLDKLDPVLDELKSKIK